MLKRDSIDLFFPDEELAVPDCPREPVPKDTSPVKQAPKELYPSKSGVNNSWSCCRLKY
ncbi:hypothetical protein ACRRTK_019370 [Alexandromys fortis]